MRHKRFLSLCLVAASAFAMSIGPAPGAQSGERTVKVEARVEPTIAVGAPSDYQFLGRIGSGLHGRIPP